MIKIGLTGSIASGKTTASIIISKRRGPLFSADDVVKKLYLKKNFRNIIVKKLKLKSNSNFKEMIKNCIFKKKGTLRKLEKIIHPKVRKEMLIFLKKNKKKKITIFRDPIINRKQTFKTF